MEASELIGRRVCTGCGVEFERGSMPPSQWNRKRFCSQGCGGRTRNREVADSRSIPEILAGRSRATPDGCVCWTGQLDASGYGVVTVRNRTQKVHRLSYEHHFGPIPAGIDVMHRCDNRPCFEPSHLALGTHLDNNADRDRKGRQAKGERIHTAKLTDAQVLEIMRSSDTQAALAKRYGVGPTAIQKIKSGAGWKHLRALQHQGEAE